MIEIRLLGELHVERDGLAVPLPPSRKSRALLAYLAATGRPHRRERLCELLWDGPDDPRAALRWSLTKLRPIVAQHLVAGRDHVSYECDDAAIDARRLCLPTTATTDLLEECAALYRGEFLEGLDLPGCFRYQQWCVGERERFRQMHIAILAELTRRHGVSDAALPHARRRVIVDPFNDQAHATLISLLASMGQNRDALQQYEHCRQLFDRELGSRPGAEVEEARRLIGVPSPSRRAATQEAVETSVTFVGRSAEIALIRVTTQPVLLLGEPGIGKSRIIEELRKHSRAPGLYGRAFAAEMVRPYGAWIEALQDFPAENDRTRLFDAVVQRLAGIAFIAIDDLQWIDEASAALLHYVVRTSAVRIVCAARVGEIDDNPHAQRLIRDLQFVTIAIGPLSPDETRALVEGDVLRSRGLSVRQSRNDEISQPSTSGRRHSETSQPRDETSPRPADRVVQLSGGNPLFALELARSGATSDAGAQAAPITAIIAARLAELSGPARELVAWAAAVGHQFDVETVGRATGMPAGEMLGALEKLERSAIIRPAGERAYDFVHDLVRDAAYQMITGPRRTLVHRHIARALRETHDPDGALAGDIVHHASLAGDHALACEAAIEAGERCLRMFAYGEAMTVGRRGLLIAEFLDGNTRMETEMRLLSVLVMSRTPVRERVPFAGKIAETTELARRAGLAKTAGLGAHLLACLYEETNNYGGAADATIQSAEMSRAADPTTAALSMATSARCLLVLQRDIDRAEELLAQAKAIGVPSHELSLGLGYLLAHQGKASEAAPHLEHALEIAARQQDHWREWLALSRLVTLALEEGDPGLARQHCARLLPVAAKMYGGSESERSEVLESVARYAMGEPIDIEAAVARLRAIDSKSDIAWVLSYLAQIEPDRERAHRFAAEALVAAETVGRHSEAVIARTILGQRAKPFRDISARARAFMKERNHGRSRTRAVV